MAYTPEQINAMREYLYAHPEIGSGGDPANLINDVANAMKQAGVALPGAATTSPPGGGLQILGPGAGTTQFDPSQGPAIPLTPAAPPGGGFSNLVNPPGTSTTSTSGGTNGTTGPATTAGSGTMNLQTYLTAHPDIIRNWQNSLADPTSQVSKDIQGYGSLENYALANALANGSPAEQAWGYVQKQALDKANADAGGGAGDATTPPAGGNFNQSQTGSQTGGFSSLGQSTQDQKQTTGSTSGTTTAGQVDTLGTSKQDTTNKTTGTIGNIGSSTNTTAGTQTGTIGNVGTTNQTQTGTTQGTTQNQGLSTEKGVTTQQGTIGTEQAGGTTTGTTGTQQTTGTTTSTPVDTLGFGKLLQGAVTGVQGTDATRNAFLEDLVKTGGGNLQSQVEQAVRNSLTGPQMTGAGDSARARAAGYAGAEMGRRNTGDRLAAASQLAGPSGFTTLINAGSPYIGQSTTSDNTTKLSSDTNVSNFLKGLQTNNLTGTTDVATNTDNTQTQNLVNRNDTNTNTNNQQTQNLATTGTSAGTTNNQQTQDLTNTGSAVGSTTGSQATTGATNTTNTGFSNLLSKGDEMTTGTATGSSKQNAAGQIPSAQTVNTGGGGCVLCTAGVELGLWKNLRVLRKVIEYKLRNKRFTSAARGYFHVFTPLAHWLLSHPRVAKTLAPLARAVVYEELRVAGCKLPLRPWASFIHWSGHSLCHIVGKFPVAGRVTDPVIESIARRNKIWFSLS